MTARAGEGMKSVKETESDKAPGQVSLIGAGPGDPKLLTLRGKEALERADAVVYDALASPTALSWARPEAEQIDVGKRGYRSQQMPQEEISELLVRLAREGKRVARLKGGDPFVFGRGGPEVQACAAAGVPFEVIPGVSSAVGGLAYAGIPLTDRELANSFAVVTGHGGGEGAPIPQIDGMARDADTLVILMGMRRLEAILTQVRDAGRAPDTPAAAVMWSTTPRQRTVVGTLATLAERVREAGLGAPSAVVVGKVVGLREELSWFERRPLFGKRVLVTRTREFAGPLTEALLDAGAEPVAIPLNRIEAPQGWDAADQALRHLEAYDAIVLTNQNAARGLFERASALGVTLSESGLQAICLGRPLTEMALDQWMSALAIPNQSFGADALSSALRAHAVLEGKRLLLPVAEDGSTRLAEAMTEAGAIVTTAPTYRVAAMEEAGELLRGKLEGGELEVITFSSPSAVRDFCHLLPEAELDRARMLCIAAVGPLTERALRQAGLEPQVVSASTCVEDFVSALEAAQVEGAAPDAPE